MWRVRGVWKQISPGETKQLLGKALAWGKGKAGEVLDGG